MSRAGVSLSVMLKVLEWQTASMRAITDGRPVPPPPPDVDINNIGDGGFDLSRSRPSRIDAQPFVDGELVFTSEIIRNEYKVIVQEHSQLIRLGERFGTFDGRMQLAFIDALEAVEERWAALFARFSLMDQVNPVFVDQTNAILGAMRLEGPDDMYALVAMAHERMRSKARTLLRLRGV